MFDQILSDFNKGNINHDSKLKWGLEAFSSKKEDLDNTCSFITTYLANLNKSKKLLIESHNSNIELENLLNQIFNPEKLRKKQTLDEIKLILKNNIERAKKYVENINHKLAYAGFMKIKPSSTILVHGDSNLVYEILEESRHKNIKVILTEGLPYSYSNLLAKKLSKINVPVTIIPDSAIAIAIKNSNLILIESTSYSRKHFFAPTGSNAIAIVANYFKKKLYFCTTDLRSTEDSLPLFIPNDSNEIVKNTPAYESVLPKDITGIISETGIHSPKSFLK